MTDAPAWDTIVELLRLRGCLVKTDGFTDGSHWVSYTSLDGHRWAVLDRNDTQRALDFLTRLNEEGI